MDNMSSNTAWVLIIAGVLFSSACFAEALRIQNDHVSASLAEDGSLTLSSGGQPFATTVLTPSSTFRKAEVDTALGKGVTLESESMRITIYPVLPFVMFQKILQNGAIVSVTNRVFYPGLEIQNVDLTTVMTTGGPQSPQTNPGSYMWTAMVNAASRKGVVGGWVTTDRGSGIVRTNNSGISAK